MSAIPRLTDMAAYCQRNAAGNAFIGLSSLTFFSATVLVPLRVYIRLRILKNFWWDDACLITAYVSTFFSHVNAQNMS